MKTIKETHYICSVCRGCYFDDETSAENCYDGHTGKERKEMMD